jgi:hypothetical protein
MQTKGLLFSLACLFASIQFAASDSTTLLGWKAGWKPAPSPQTDLLAAEALVKLTAYYAANGAQGNCTLDNVSVRREWYEQEFYNWIVEAITKQN